ncbi:radical SAM protein [Clostridiaceae bacterium M8S5]|nr:radical SAM protein [Clostridiaceae bacterium M8S5]
MGLIIKWDITYKCNLYCKHCINSDFLNNRVDELKTSEIINIIDKISKCVPIDYMHILGGEPTFREDFIKITDYLDELKIKFGFNTNGLNINKSKFRKLLLNKSLNNIVISLEGPIAEINNKIRGKNVFDIVVRNVKSLVEFKKENKLEHLSLTINTVVSSLNYDYIIDMVDFCVDLGVQELNLLALIPSGNATDDMMITDEQELELVKNIAIKYAETKDKIEISPKFARPIVKDYCKQILDLDFPRTTHACGAGTNFAFINNLGQLAPCDKFLYEYIKKEDRDIYSIRDRDYFSVWSEEIFNIPYKLTEGVDFYKKYKPCNECKYLKAECYPCFIPHSEEEEVQVKQCMKYFELLNKEQEAY